MPVVRGIDEETCTDCGECVTACPLGAANVHYEKGIAIICDRCDGELACVTNCIQGALKFVPTRDVAQHKRRVTA